MNMNTEAPTSDAFINALDLVVKHIDQFKSLTKAATQDEKGHRIKELEKEVDRLKKVNQSLIKTLSCMKLASPPGTVPVEAVILTAPSAYPHYEHAYTSIFEDTVDWPKLMDRHAELVLSLQCELTGLTVLRMSAKIDEENAVIAYSADCRLVLKTVSATKTTTRQTLTFKLDFVKKDNNGTPEDMVQYTPGSIMHFNTDQRRRLGKFGMPFSFTRDYMYLLLQVMQQTLGDIDREDSPPATPINEDSPMHLFEASAWAGQEEQTSPTSPPPVMDNDDETTTDEDSENGTMDIESEES
ncbi:hypothetical protein VNI00_004010 [Paramarasmius palmivorus]|uniref:Uncharacterized protein n=1 Tax=Paramarasmius palmivorus TaxID=297713 RepID=A0AAW0DLI3_9AGAR